MERFTLLRHRRRLIFIRPALCGRLFKVHQHGDVRIGQSASVAQWIERLPPEQKAVGSIPIGGTSPTSQHPPLM